MDETRQSPEQFLKEIEKEQHKTGGAGCIQNQGVV